MENYLEASADGHTHFQLSKKVAEQLKGFVINPGNFSLFDTLIYLFEEYQWKISVNMPLADFIRKAQEEGYESAVVFGDAIIKILEDDEDETEI